MRLPLVLIALLAGVISGPPAHADDADDAARPRVLVVPLKPLALDADTTRIVDAMIVAEFSRNEALDVVSADDIQQLSDLEAQKQAAGCDQASCLGELAGALGARYAVFGNLGRLGSQTVLAINLFDAQAGRALSRDTLTVASVDTLPGALGPVVQKLVGKIPHPVVAALPQAPTGFDGRDATARSDDARATTTPAAAPTTTTTTPATAASAAATAAPVTPPTRAPVITTTPGGAIPTATSAPIPTATTPPTTANPAATAPASTANTTTTAAAPAAPTTTTDNAEEHPSTFWPSAGVVTGTFVGAALGVAAVVYASLSGTISSSDYSFISAILVAAQSIGASAGAAGAASLVGYQWLDGGLAAGVTTVGIVGAASLLGYFSRSINSDASGTFTYVEFNYGFPLTGAAIAAYAAPIAAVLYAQPPTETASAETTPVEPTVATTTPPSP